MALATVYSRARQGLDAPLVNVEVHLGNGLPGFSLVGLPAAAVRESKDRVRAALLNSGFSFPARRITVNLAPADLPKDGGRFDLPIAIGILAAAGELEASKLDKYEFLGELSLSGELRPVIGALPAMLATRADGRELILPEANRDELALVSEEDCLSATDLLSVCAHLSDQQRLPVIQPVSGCDSKVTSDQPDLSDVRGQQQARRALEIAAAGGHHLLMVGPPGSGKTMLAMRLPGLLPPLENDEAVEIAALRSISAGGQAGSWRVRPFRAPHHSASGVALVGGGGLPRPGEISLAHHGVLFLDELPEFSRQTLDCLREPLESGEITVSRAARHATFPARFQLIAAMNPCPCGWWGDASGRCHCSIEQVRRYTARVSGPLMDRMDLQLHVKPVPRTWLSPAAGAAVSEGSEMVRQRVMAARQAQISRQGQLNAMLAAGQLDSHMRLSEDAARLLDEALERMGWSARAYHRVLRVARTIADLAGSAGVEQSHVGEALHYRQLDRSGTLPSAPISGAALI